MPLEALAGALPNKRLNDASFASLLEEARLASYYDPRFGLAAARVAQAEARRAGSELRQAQADYALTACLNKADDWNGALAQALQTRHRFERLGRELDAARCDWQAAYALRYLADYRQAERLAAGVEAVFRRRRVSVGLGWALIERARNLNQLDQLSASGEALAEGRRIFTGLGHAPGLAWCALADAVRLFHAGRLAETLPEIESAWLTFRRLGRPVDQAWAEFYVGYVTSALRDYDRAVDSLEQAASQFQRLGLWFRHNLALYQLGATLLEQGKFVRARQSLAASLACFEKLQPDSLYSGLARTNLGLASLMAGDLAAAEELLIAARGIFSRLDSPRWLAWADMCLGFLAREHGRFDNAIHWLESAARACRALGDERNAALAAEELAGLYLLLGDTQRGIGLLQASLDYFEASRRPVDLARAKIRLAHAYVTAGQPGSALPLLAEAAACAAQIESEWLGARAEYVTGEALAGLGRYAEADQHLGLAVTLYDRQHLPAERAAAALGRADLWRRQGKLEGARELMNLAAAGWSLKSPELAWRFHLLRARLAPTAAVALEGYQASIAALQTARSSLSQEELAGAYLAERGCTFDEAIDLAVRIGRPRAALEFSEESRAQMLAGQLRQPAPAAAKSGPARSPAARRRDRLRARIRVWRDQAAGRAGLAGSHSRRPSLEAMQANYYEAAATARRETGVSLRDPAGWAAFDWPAFCARAADFLPAGWRGLAYQRAGRQLLVFEFSPDGVAVRPVAPAQPGGDPLAEVSAMLQESATGYLWRAGEVTRRKLYDRLIPPDTARRLRPDQPLLILPCGALNSLAFHALQDSEGQFLVERALVAYAPSLLALDLLARRRAEAAPKPGAPGGSLCLVAYTGGAHGLEALPAARREVDALTEAFESNVLRLEARRASRAALAHLSATGKLAEFEYVHLLAHGLFDEQSSRGSRLALADGGLLVDDAAGLRLQARVVTLSACEAGLREVFPGEEWVGLTQAFLAAGADCVVSGLWRVADKVMPGPMRQFYKNLLAGHSPAAALCAAQRRALAVTPDPYYWAPLTAMGLP